MSIRGLSRTASMTWMELRPSFQRSRLPRPPTMQPKRLLSTRQQKLSRRKSRSYWRSNPRFPICFVKQGEYNSQDNCASQQNKGVKQWYLCDRVGIGSKGINKGVNRCRQYTNYAPAHQPLPVVFPG